MQNIRQGILSRQKHKDFGRNINSSEQQHQKQNQQLQGKEEKLTSYFDRRRMLYDGTQEERQFLKSQYYTECKANLDLKQKIKNDQRQQEQREKNEIFQRQKYENEVFKQKEELKKDYQKKILQDNKLLIMEKEQQRKNQRAQEIDQDNQMIQKNYLSRNIFNYA